MFNCWNLTFLIYGFIVYFLIHKTPRRSHAAMVWLFAITQGKSNDFMHYCITKFKKTSLDFSGEVSGILGTYSRKQITEIVDKIREDGYYVINDAFPSELVNSIYSFAITTQSYIRPLESDMASGSFLNRESAPIDLDNPKTIRYDFDQSQLINNVDFQTLLSDKIFLAISQEYLRCLPVVDVVSLWWHTAFSQEANDSAAMLYHFDMDRIKWLKFFFYLTDVTIDNGPHGFIRGSHKSGAIPKSLLKHNAASVSDSDVLEYYGKDREITYVAPKGTLIIEDTRGLHKGFSMKSGARLMGQIQYSDCLFGQNYKPGTFNQLNSELKIMIEKYPTIYKQYIRKC